MTRLALAFRAAAHVPAAALAQHIGALCKDGAMPNTLCMTGAAFGESSESCFALHRQDTAFAAKRVSGWPAVCNVSGISLQ